MIISNYQTSTSRLDPITLIRLERAIYFLALSLGFDGDPLAKHTPEAQTQGDLEAAHDLLQKLPAELRNINRELALKMCQAAVFGSSRTVINTLQPSQAPNKSAAQTKLARERNLQGRSDRWSSKN